VIANLVLTVIIVCAFECTFALQRPQIGKLENRMRDHREKAKTAKGNSDEVGQGVSHLRTLLFLFLGVLGGEEGRIVSARTPARKDACLPQFVLCVSSVVCFSFR
jgi:hypothetical protein